MVYKSYKIQSTSEILLALLSEFPFESFQELEDHMIAYIPDESLDADNTAAIHTIINGFGVDYSVEEIQPQNWNAIWESSFTPVIVEEFCQVRANFHPSQEGITHDLIINPKMAFGTGHHETTYMMIKAMEHLSFENKSVFDYGCGTGVLAILASKMGAEPILAIDIEEESYLNTLENAKTNNTPNINAAQATLESTKLAMYDIILANINRNVLLQSAEKLFEILKPGGTILLSGILDQDEKLVLNTYQEAGFEMEAINERGYWRCIELKK